MKRHIRLFLSLAAILLLVASASRPARADGIALPVEESEVEMPAQQAILVWDEERGHEDLILSVELLGSPEAAWVVPLPSLPEVRTASPRWFDHLNLQTMPIIKEFIVYEDLAAYEHIQRLGAELEAGKGVALIRREEVGIHDVSILSADEPGALLAWLNENGYAFPEEGGPILDAHVAEGGWYFVAARVLPRESARLAGYVSPLWLSFDTEQPIYPMRLTALADQVVGVLIYVLADHGMKSRPGWLSTEFAGALNLIPIPQERDADLVDLLTHRPYYVTRLRAHAFSPTLMREDLYFERAYSDEAYREVSFRIRYESLPSRPTQAQRGWLGLGLNLAPVGLLVGLGLVWLWWSRRNLEEL